MHITHQNLDSVPMPWTWTVQLCVTRSHSLHELVKPITICNIVIFVQKNTIVTHKFVYIQSPFGYVHHAKRNLNIIWDRSTIFKK